MGPILFGALLLGLAARLRTQVAAAPKLSGPCGRTSDASQSRRQLSVPRSASGAEYTTPTGSFGRKRRGLYDTVGVQDRRPDKVFATAHLRQLSGSFTHSGVQDDRTAIGAERPHPKRPNADGQGPMAPGPVRQAGGRRRGLRTFNLGDNYTRGLHQGRPAGLLMASVTGPRSALGRSGDLKVLLDGLRFEASSARRARGHRAGECPAAGRLDAR